MKYVYIDESGETGKRSSYIVFASVSTDKPRQIEKMAKKIWKAKPQLHALGELHAHEVDGSIRTRVLKSLTSLDVVVSHSVIKKSKYSKALDLVYYAELSSFIKLHKEAHIVVVDKKDTNKKRQTILKQLNLQDDFSNVVFESSHAVKPLQIVDFVAWAIGRYYETGDGVFYDMIKGLENE